jgi:hypothetical protein
MSGLILSPILLILFHLPEEEMATVLRMEQETVKMNVRKKNCNVSIIFNRYFSAGPTPNRPRQQWPLCEWSLDATFLIQHVQCISCFLHPRCIFCLPRLSNIKNSYFSVQIMEIIDDHDDSTGTSALIYAVHRYVITPISS